MGKSWDEDKGGRDKWIAWLAGILGEANRCLKPGAHGLVWALPRTQHWTQMACEDAGFEIRDVISHVFGTGFPKSLNVSKAIDSAAGAEREVVGQQRRAATGRAQQGEGGYAFGEDFDTTVPATDAAKQWDGWGTALKPAHEAWILCRKPIDGTVAQNVLEHGTGGINVDGCRVGTSGGTAAENFGETKGVMFGGGKGKPTNEIRTLDAGRWPPNLVLSHSADCAEQCVTDCPIAELGSQSGERPGMSSGGKHSKDYPGGMFGGIDSEHTARGDTGTAARFFPQFKYQAKPSKGEKNAGLDEPNTHPTVKSVKLMAWLCRLVTPPGGIILDPFTGSGSTGVAALAEGFQFVGIEGDFENAKIARNRLKHALSE